MPLEMAFPKNSIVPHRHRHDNPHGWHQPDHFLAPPVDTQPSETDIRGGDVSLRQGAAEGRLDAEDKGGLVFLGRQKEVITTYTMAEWKQRVVSEGMKLVEEERKQTDAMQLLLQRRIEALSEELEITRKERDELMEVAEELAAEKEIAEQHKSACSVEGGAPARGRLCSLVPPWLTGFSPAICGSGGRGRGAQGGRKDRNEDHDEDKPGTGDTERRTQKPGLRLSGSFEWSF